MILVREFGGPDTSYRIPITRAREYRAFLVYIHNTFNKPWERYSLHLHLDNTVCDGRVSPSEWEAGAYFETEFILEDRLVLYAHFEEVERRKLDFNVEEESAACRWGSDGTKEHQDKWNGVKVEKLDDEDYEGWRDDPYPPFQEKLVNTEPMTSTVRAKSSLTTLASRQAQSPTLHTTSTSSTLGPSPRLASKAIAPAEDMCSAQHQEAGIPVGHAKPHCCRDPNIRPVVYVIFNSTGNLSAYMPGKVARRTVANGDAKISLRDIDYDPAFLDVRYEEQRNVAIRHELQAKLAQKDQTVPGLQLLLPNSAPKRKHARSPGPSDNLTPHDDSMNSRSAMGEGIIIGHAAVGSCRDPSKPPPVWAALSSTGALCAYIPAKDSLRAFARGCAQINMENVVFCAEYRGLSQAKRIEHIKEIVRSNQKSNDEHRRRCKRKSEEYASGGEVLMDVEREQKFWCTEVPERGLGCFSEALVGK